MLSWWQRRKLHRAVERRHGAYAASQVKSLSNFGASFYVAYASSGADHDEALRLAVLSARLGDDVTNYPEIASSDEP